MEPRSMFEVVKESLRASNRVTFLHRVVCIGEHKLGRSIEEFMRGLVSTHAEQYNDEPLTGFLLAYHTHFIHILEGSECTLTRHLRAVTDPEESPAIGSVKVLLETTHINKRYFSAWSSRSAAPPALAQPLETPAPVAEVARQADNVLGKTLRLVDAVKRLPSASASASGPSGGGSQLGHNSSLVLPEPELLHFLLAAEQLRDVRALIREHDVPPRLVLYEDMVWPMQPDYVPYNIFDKAQFPAAAVDDQPEPAAVEGVSA